MDVSNGAFGGMGFSEDTNLGLGGWPVIAEYALYDLGTIYWYFKEDYATGARNITAN